MVVESPVAAVEETQPALAKGENANSKDEEKLKKEEERFMKKEPRKDAGKLLLQQRNRAVLQHDDAHKYSDDPTNLIVNYLPVYFTQEHLRDLFAGYGEIESLIVMCTKHDSYKRKSKGYGFVKFTTAEAAAAAIAGVDGTKIANKTIKVSVARPGRARRCSNVFVSRLPLEWNNHDLQEAFSKFGHVVECRVLKFSDGKSRRCGFVRYDSDEEAKTALKEMTGFRPSPHDSPLQVNLSVNHNPDSQKPAAYRHNNSMYPSHRGWSLAEHINDTMHSKDKDEKLNVPRASPTRTRVSTDAMFERNPPPARRPWEKPRRSSRRDRVRGDRGDRDRSRRSYRHRYDDDYERPQSFDDFHDRMHSSSSKYDPQIYKTDPSRMPYDRITDNHRNYEGYSSPYVHREPKGTSRKVYNDYHADSNRDRFYHDDKRDAQEEVEEGEAPATDEPEGESRLFVQNLPTFYEESHLTQLFSSYGEISTATVQRDKKGKSIGTAFVTFRKKTDALKAIEALDEVMLSTQTLKIRQM